MKKNLTLLLLSSLLYFFVIFFILIIMIKTYFQVFYSTFLTPTIEKNLFSTVKVIMVTLFGTVNSFYILTVKNKVFPSLCIRKHL